MFDDMTGLFAGQHVTLVRFREPEDAVRVGSGIAQDLKMADGATQEEAFEEWLSSRMKQLGLDEDVFGSYITGVLDSEDTDEDRKDALKGILDGMTQYPLNDLCNEVIERWRTSRAEVLQEKELEKEQKATEKQNRLAEIMEKQASTVSSRKSTQADADGEVKKLLLAQYGHESDEDYCTESDDEQASCSSAEKDLGMVKNMNTQSVADKEKDKRDKMKEESEQRKQQIKEAKEKQKQKADERKEKERKRTQKGERRTR